MKRQKAAGIPKALRQIGKDGKRIRCRRKGSEDWRHVEMKNQLNTVLNPELTAGGPPG
jgi:hypothetical protein